MEFLSVFLGDFPMVLKEYAVFWYFLGSKRCLQGQLVMYIYI